MPTCVAMVVRLPCSIEDCSRPPCAAPGRSRAGPARRPRTGSWTGWTWDCRPMTGLHPLAATGFGGADLYDRGRPDYPPAAIAALGLPAGTRVLDLAAGTGK